MSFSLWAVFAESPIKRPDTARGGIGRLLTCKRRTSRVLGLHSCRALSPRVVKPV